MQSSDFIKSVNFRSYLKKKCIQNLKMLIFYLKIDFYLWKNIFLICNKVYSDRSEIDHSNAIIRISNFRFSRKLWWKNWWNYYVAEKCIVSRLSKISNPKIGSANWRLECNSCQISRAYILLVSEKWDVKERDGRTGSGFSLIVFLLWSKEF